MQIVVGLLLYRRFVKCLYNLKYTLRNNNALIRRVSGDGRVSEQVGLTSLHTIFMREHNRIAEILHRLNPHWSDEILYQNARKIFTGAYQHIVYNEFLPRILGWDAVDKYDLRLSSTGYYKSK